MHEPTCVQLPKQEYLSSPVSVPAAASLEQEAENIWQKNREILERFKKDILTSQPRSKEFRFAVRVAKHFFRTDNTYDANGVSEALQFIDVIRKRHEAVAATSAEGHLLRSVRKVLSAIFQHHYKFENPEDLEKIITAYNALSTRYTALGEESLSAPFTIPSALGPSMAIDPTLTNSVMPQGLVLRPPPPVSDPPAPHSEPSSPTPLHTTDTTTPLILFNPPSTSDAIYLPFQVENQPIAEEGIVEQPPPPAARPSNRIASLLIQARALATAAQTEAAVIEPPGPVVVSTENEVPGGPDDTEMQAGEPQLEEDMYVEWAPVPEPVETIPEEKQSSAEDAPMETLVEEATHEVTDVDAPAAEVKDDDVDSLFGDPSTPSIPHPERPVMEKDISENVPPSVVTEECREELHEAMRPLAPYLQAKSATSGVGSQTMDPSFVSRYGPELMRVAQEALNQIRTRYDVEEVYRSLKRSPVHQEESLPEQAEVELPDAQEEMSSPRTPELDVESETASPDVEITIPMDMPLPSESTPRTYSEQSVQTSDTVIQPRPEKQQTRLYEVQEIEIATFTVHNDCCRIGFSFEIASEFYTELRNDRTAKMVAVCCFQEPEQVADDPIDDSWILMRINPTCSSDTEFLLVPNKPGNTSTNNAQVQQIIPWGIVESINRLELRRSWCLGGLRGLRVDMKVVRAVRQQRKRGRETVDGESQDEGDSEVLGHVVDSFKRARI